MNIEPLPYDHPDAVRLIDGLLADLDERYGLDGVDDPDGDADEWRAEVTPEKVVAPHGAFLVARLDGEAVGCGAIKRYDASTAEVKRMYTAPAGRRRGLARMLLTQLEAEARALGYTMIRLETGTPQPEAIALYASMGYAPIDSYGRYSFDGRSRCFEKAL